MSKKNKKLHKCYYDKDSNFHECTGMGRLLNLDSRLEVSQVINLTENLKTRDAFIACKPLRTKKLQGIVFNVCPFCCEKLVNDKQQLNTDKVPYYKK